MFWPLYLTNLWGVMNDNLLKMLVCFVAVRWLPGEWHSVVVNLTAGMLVLPYVFVSPVAGRLPSLTSKVRVVRLAKLAEVPIMLVAIAGLLCHSVPLLLTAVLLMGTQSALFSPAKYGLIKDIGGPGRISEGLGGMEALSFVGMLSGTVLAAFAVDHVPEWGWGALLLCLAALGLASSLGVRAREERSGDDAPAGPLSFLRHTGAIVRRYPGLMGVIILLSLYWWMAASLQTGLLLHCQRSLGLSPATTGLLLAAMAVGISLGCLVGGRLDKRHDMVGLSPLLGGPLTLALTLMFAFGNSLAPLAASAVAMALVAGMFKIPLDAEMQKRVGAESLSLVIAFFNQVSFIFIFLASATNIAVMSVLPTRYVFLFDAAVLAAACVVFVLFYRRATSQVGRLLLGLHYDVEERGREALRLAPGQNMLVLPAHRAIVDPLLLFAWMDDCQLRPLCDEGFFRIPGVRQILRTFGAIAVPDLSRGAKGAEKHQRALLLKPAVIQGLREGGNILLYPSGHVTLDGRESLGARQLAHDACRELPERTRVVAVRVDGLWGSSWSRHRRDSSPSLVAKLLQGAAVVASGAWLLWPKRKVTLTYVDLTDQARQWGRLTRLQFNRHLEEVLAQGWPGGKEEVS